jgi:hypothetical protein
MADPWPTVARVLLALLSVGLWVVWWLWAVNWNKLWPVLARGGWAPVVLLVLVLSAAWSRITPDDPDYPPFNVLPPFGRQLAAAAALAGLALFCGWLQGRLGWAPAEVAVEPAATAADGHGPAHH